MNCKEMCVHSDVCPNANYDEYGSEEILACDCPHYKPKSRFEEVVRCKDCRHWGGTTFGFVCRKFSGIETKICMGADHFCSYGEKALKERENE